jgi:hypothetical protein
LGTTFLANPKAKRVLGTKKNLRYFLLIDCLPVNYKNSKRKNLLIAVFWVRSGKFLEKKDDPEDWRQRSGTVTNIPIFEERGKPEMSVMFYIKDV